MAPIGGLDGFREKLSNEGMKGGSEAVTRCIPLFTPAGMRRPATSQSPEHRPDFRYSPQDAHLSWSPMSAAIGAASPDRSWPARMSERISPAAPRPISSHSSWSPGSTAAAGLQRPSTSSHLGLHSPADSASSLASTSTHFGGSFPRTRARRKPNDAEKSMANIALVDGRRSSHAYGFRSPDGGVASPPIVPRPLSSVNISLRNPVIRTVCEPDALGTEHRISSDAIGVHTGTASDRGRFVRPRTSHAAMARGDSAASPALWQRTARTSDAYGTFPASPPLDWNNAAAVHYEASYARAFPGEKTPIANRTPAAKAGRDAVRHQDEMLKRAKAQDGPRMKEHYQSSGDQTSLMVRDGERVAKLDFDNVFSQKHITKDTESVLKGPCISTVDPRRNMVRPPSLGYGSSIDGQPVHRVSTAYGARRVMPARSFMKIGIGTPGRNELRDGRHLDF